MLHSGNKLHCWHIYLSRVDINDIFTKHQNTIWRHWLSSTTKTLVDFLTIVESEIEKECCELIDTATKLRELQKGDLIDNLNEQKQNCLVFFVCSVNA